MTLFLGTDELTQPITPYPVVAIGNFDGLHIGHQATLTKTKERAREKKGTSVVLTFRPHPSHVLSPQRPTLLLTSFEEKLRLMESFGIDVVILVEFNKEFAHQTPQMFIQNLLAETIGCREVIVGERFSFGKNRSGKVPDLIQLGRRFGFDVITQEVVVCDGDPVSSSAIRLLLQRGNVKQAAQLLSRPYQLGGEVVHADGMGTRLGFPTANINLTGKLIPKEGVYAVRTILPSDPSPFDAIAYIGSKPTFNQDGKIQLEVYLFDFRGSLYGQHLDVHFVEWIRPDKKFDNRMNLIRQMQQDTKKARLILGNV